MIRHGADAAVTPHVDGRLHHVNHGIYKKNILSSNIESVISTESGLDIQEPND